ncbi:MAG: flagellar basal-body rod protein FlgF [Rhizobiales bacterium]|nr:flagellar basal-body rod protein FlgF [Hyphomicrobiales bacterium]
MATGSFVALSGQLALDARLSTIANNIANARTVGFRANGVNFNPLVSSTQDFDTVFASTGKNHVNLNAGGFTRTGNPLDIAVHGDGFLAYTGPTGTYYSRDGRLSLTDTGELVNVLGQPVQDVGGSSITVDPKAGAVEISRDGGVHQAGQRVGQIGLFSINLNAGFTRAEGSGLVPVTPAEQLTDYANNSIVQGFVEEANVNAVTEMVKLIQVTRAFEAASTYADKMLESEMDAIRTLGAR